MTPASPSSSGRSGRTGLSQVEELRYYKVLDANNHSCNGGSPNLVWSLPTQNEDGTWTPGEWMPEVQGDLELCANGYHLTNADHLLDWLNATIYEAEPSEELIEGDDKIVCRSVRLLKKLHWDDRIARLFACDCAERVLPIYERDYPDDKRPRHAVETARLFADGKASDNERDAARDAAQAAAWDAARDAAWGAARAARAAQAAAWDAARDAAQAAAWDAAWDAARAAAWAAGAAANAAWDVAGEKEHRWQVKRLMQYLEGKK